MFSSGENNLVRRRRMEIGATLRSCPEPPDVALGLTQAIARYTMARPKQAQIRDQKITVRLTAEEVVQLRERAVKARQSMTDFVRHQVLDGRKMRRAVKTADRQLPNHGAPIALELPVFQELRRIGVNLNQIARHCHTHQLPPPAGTDTAMAALLALINKSLPS